jgi:carbamate kinase
VEALRLAADNGWIMGKDGAKFRRMVASPIPKRIFAIEVIRLLVEQSVTVICAGGGGIPVIRQPDGNFAGVEAVIDKDRASALLASVIGAQALLMLTDVDGVYLDWGTDKQSVIARTNPSDIRKQTFASGSMGPKVEAAATFVASGGTMAGIGRLEDAKLILEGNAGTIVAA